MAGLQIGAQFEFLERFGGGGADRSDHRPAQAGQHGRGASQFAGHARQVPYLHGRGEQSHVEFAGGQAACGLAQRPNIFGQRVLVDAHRGGFGAAGAQGLQQLGILPSILLHRDAAFGTSLRCRH